MNILSKMKKKSTLYMYNPSHIHEYEVDLLYKHESMLFKMKNY